MIEIRTGSRVHFGLFQAGPASPGQRRFGGAGMMVNRPGLRLQALPAPSWSADGPLAERTLAFAHRCAEGLEKLTGNAIPPQRFVLAEAVPEHAGLGTGTQLGMAVARLLAVVGGRPELPVSTLAALVSRGRRSGLGVHGFERGGFLVDGGKRDKGTLAPLVAWSAVPEEWRIVLVLPPGDRDWQGRREQLAFDALESDPHTDRLCRLVLLELLPALLARDLDAFGEALFELNALAGEAFSSAQGGTYAGPQVAETVRLLRSLGVKGVGQSSWGPTVFAVVGDGDQARFIASRVRPMCSLADDAVLIASPMNRGAEMQGSRSASAG